MLFVSLPFIGFWLGRKYQLLITVVEECQIEKINDNSEDVQLANPASVNCFEKGGKLSIVDKTDGQVGMCTLSNGVVCEEWEYFRGECQ